ncbi:MAG TPA: ABC transporter permease [Bryobacteraceae bacterium]|nr:ABC transporter permease [Bryobacteraceae bacterium]
MRRTRKLFVRLFGLFEKNRRERDLAEEIESHLQLHIADNIRAGMSPGAARREALLKLGGVERTKDEYRDQRSIPTLESLLQDLRYAARMLRRSPGFTAVAVLSLALGIGANATIFSVINSLMLRALPVRNPEQLVTIGDNDGQTRTNYFKGYGQYQKFRQLTQVFSSVAAVGNVDRSNVAINGTGGGMDTAQVRVALVSGNYFSMLGVQPLIGRTLTPDDDRVPGGHPVAMIGYGYWERRFALSSGVIGRTLTLNGTTYTIVGVTPRGFLGDWVGRPTDLWLPIMMQAQVMPEGRVGVRIVGRLKPGVIIQQAQAAAEVVHQRDLREFWPNPTPERMQYMARLHVALAPAGAGFSPQRDSYGASLTILMAVVGVVLLIACANVTNLLLARSAARQREMAVRRAIGAGHLRLLQQLFTESVLLALMGGALGLLFSVWATNALSAAVGSGPVLLGSRSPSPWISLDLHPDWRVLSFTAGLCLLTGILFGLAPAFRSAGTSLSPALIGRGAVSGSAGGRFRLGRVLVVSQVALSLVLLIVAGLFVRTLHNLKSADLGVDRQHLLLIWAAPGQAGHRGPELAAFWRTLRDRLASLPGVLSASESSIGLLTGIDGGGPSEMLRVEGRPPKPGLLMWQAVIAPRFFETVGVTLLGGRDLNERDNEAGAPQVAVINETMARFFFGGENPIGKHFGSGRDIGTPVEIVGVVRDAKHGAPGTIRGMWYVPYRPDSGLGTMCVVVRAAGPAAGMAARVRQELRAMDASLPVLKIDTVDEQLDTVLVQERLTASLAGMFGGLAAILACLGLYGVMSYTTARRTNEIGIRMALGSTRLEVLHLVLMESLLMIVIGTAIGISAALGATRLISTKLFGITATDPITIAAAALLMIAVGALAGFLPAQRASRVDPIAALRYE